MCYYNGEAQREFVVELTKPAPNPRGNNNDTCLKGEDHRMYPTDISGPAGTMVTMRPLDGHASPFIPGFGRVKYCQIALPAMPSLLHKLTSGLAKTYAKVYETVVPQPGPENICTEKFKTAESNVSDARNVKSSASSKAVSSAFDDCSFEHVECEEARDCDDMDLDDEDGFHKERVGELINSRYEVEELLGKGTFGKVLKCFDHDRHEYVVIKMIRNTPAFFEAAQREIQMLKLMNQADPQDKFNIVKMKDHFIFHSHQCIVFELLAESLYDLLRAGNFKGVSLNAIRKFARQILVSLEFMSRSDVNLMHCDLKPENILLRSSNSRTIKVIDFGSSCQETRQYYTYIQSRYYRAPEVIFRLPCYTKAIDMWSLGCLLLEMHTGQPIFDGRDILEQVHSMCSLLGIPPDYMLRRGTQSGSYFVEIENDMDSNDLHESRWEMVPWITREKGSKRRNLCDILGVFANGPCGRWKNHPGHATIDYLVFKDLVEKMLVYDPAERITASEALDHPFFSNSKHARRPTVERPLSMECMAYVACQKGKSSAWFEKDDYSGIAVLNVKPASFNEKGKPVSSSKTQGQFRGSDTTEAWGDVDVDFTNAFDAAAYVPTFSKQSTVFPQKQGSTFSSIFSGGQHNTVPCVS